MKLISINWQILQKQCHLVLVKHQCHKYNKRYEFGLLLDGYDTDDLSEYTICCLNNTITLNRKRNQIKQEIKQLKNKKK